MKKRILSLLLILSMLVSMIPAYAGNTETGTSYCYNLARLQYGRWSTEGVDPITIKEYEDLDALGNYYNRTTDPFKIWNQSSGMAWKWTASSNNDVGPTIQGVAAHFGGLLIRVGESAVYDITLKLLDNAAASKLDFYLAPASETSPMSDKYYLGSTNYTEATPVLKDFNYGERYLEAGDYVFAFKSTEKGDALTAISKIYLNWVTDEKPLSNYCYNLARLQHGRWSSDGNNPSILTDWDTINTLGNYYNRTTDPFMYYGQSEGMTWTWTASSNNGVGPTIKGAVGEWGGMKIRVGESAQYLVNLKLLDNAAASNMKFYLAPADAENPRSDEYYLGETNYTETTQILKNFSFGARYLEQGDYALVFELTTEAASGTSAILTSIAEVNLIGVGRWQTLPAETVDGAAIRISEPQGMRFTSTIDRALADSEDVVEYGTILMPTDDLDGDINNLVFGYSKNGHTAITAPALIHYAEDEETYTFTAVLIDTQPKYYSRSISARAYVKLADGTYLYGETSSARSIYQVAELILKNADATDEEKAVAQEIVDTVLNLESKDNDAAWPWN